MLYRPRPPGAALAGSSGTILAPDLATPTPPILMRLAPGTGVPGGPEPCPPTQVRGCTRLVLPN